MEKGEIVIYQADDSIQLDVRIDQETVWRNQSQIGILFGVDRTVVVRHIGNIYKAEELEEYATCVKIAQVQIEGKRKVERMLNYYNLRHLGKKWFAFSKMHDITRADLLSRLRP